MADVPPVAALLVKPHAHVPARSGRAPRCTTRRKPVRPALGTDAMARARAHSVRRGPACVHTGAQCDLIAGADRTSGIAPGRGAGCRSRTHNPGCVRATPQDAPAKPETIVPGRKRIA